MTNWEEVGTHGMHHNCYPKCYPSLVKVMVMQSPLS